MLLNAQKPDHDRRTRSPMAFRVRRSRRSRLRGYPSYQRPRHPARAAARVLVLSLILAMPAAALAATPVADGGPEAKPAAEPRPAATAAATRLGDGAERDRAAAVPTVAAGVTLTAHELRAGAGELAELGPYDPLDARPDYGDAEAAFGNARGRLHEGQDMFAPAGTRIVAPTAGRVVDSGSDAGRGNWLAIYDRQRDQTYNFFHMNAPTSLAQGERVEAGEKVGEVGCTGSCYGSHLHFEVRAGRGPYGPASDPLPLLRRWPRLG